MRVLQLGKYWGKDGGIETHVRSLSKSLASANVDVVNLVSSTTSKGDCFQVDGYCVLESATLGVVYGTSIAPGMVFSARRLQAERSFDVIHLHFPDPSSHLVSLSLPANIPRVITWHSDIVKQRNLLKLYRPFQEREVRRAKAIIAATKAHFLCTNQIPMSYPNEKKFVIPYGIDFNWLAIDSALEQKVESLRAEAAGRPLVFSLGRHVDYKGFDVLLKSLQSTSAYLVLGGEGPRTPQLKAQADRLGIGERIKFTGRLVDKDVAAYYHACDFFCLPSVTPNEAFGIVQIEAMACGKPVICTQLHNGVNEINIHLETGLTVKSSDPVALAKAINQLCHDAPLRVRLGQQARQRVLKNFSVQSMLDQHLALYQRMQSIKF